MKRLILSMLVGLFATTASAQSSERRVHAYRVSSASMEPTLRVDELVMSDRQPDDCGDVAGLEAGDIVVRLQNGTPRISRLVGTPGQTIEMRGGVLLIDGRAATQFDVGPYSSGGTQGRVLRETLPSGRSYDIYRMADPSRSWRDDLSPIHLGPDEWFFVSDNRLNAIDSRDGGPAKTIDLCGQLTHLYFSQDPSRVRALR